MLPAAAKTLWDPTPMTDDANRPKSVEEAILQIAAERGQGKTLCPSEAARAVYPKDWQNRMRQIRQIAIHLARNGQISIYRKGRPVDPNDFRGVYRLGLPPMPPKDS